MIPRKNPMNKHAVILLRSKLNPSLLDTPEQIPRNQKDQYKNLKNDIETSFKNLFGRLPSEEEFMSIKLDLSGESIIICV